MENSSPNPPFPFATSEFKNKSAEVLANPFPKKYFCQNFVRIVPPPARILGGQNPERKTPFPFSKEISPPPNQESKEGFSFGVAEALRGSGGAIHSRSKKVRANAKITPPKLICIRIDRARVEGEGLVWHFRQEIPRGFEFRQKHSRREAAVPQANACSVLRTGADAERLQIVGVSAMPLSI